MKHKLLICFFAALFIIDNVYVTAQETAKNTQEKQLEEKAFALFRAEKFSEALPLMSQLLSMFPKEPEYNYGYAACLIETNQETDIKNQEKSNQEPQNETIKLSVNKASRRYQELGTAAPVSSRNYKKRKIALEGLQASIDANTESPKSNPMVQT